MFRLLINFNLVVTFVNTCKFFLKIFFSLEETFLEEKRKMSEKDQFQMRKKEAVQNVYSLSKFQKYLLFAS